MRMGQSEPSKVHPPCMFSDPPTSCYVMFSLSNRDIFRENGPVWTMDGSESQKKSATTGQTGATVGVLTPIKKNALLLLNFFRGQKLASTFEW